MEMVSKVSIVVPAMNRKDEVVACLISIQKTDYPNYEVVVVDDASTDGMPLEVEGKFKDVKLIRNYENRGAAISRNLGAGSSEGEYIFFLDSDTVIEEGTVQELVNGFGAFPGTGVVVPMIYYHEERDRIWFAGARISLVTSKAKYRGLGDLDRGQFHRVEVINNGHPPCAFMVKREVFDAVGGFDATFFMGFEESDLAKHIENQGYHIVFNPRAKVWHKIPRLRYESKLREFLFYVSFRNERIAYHTSRNRIRYMKRYAGKIRLSLFVTLFLPASLVVYAIKCVFSKRLAMLVSIFRGSVDGLKDLCLRGS
jgi:GT2 family glycosyltransferase